MPRYNVKLFGNTVTSFETDESLTQTAVRRLQGGSPDTKVDSGGSANGYSFGEQELDRDELREIKEMRETGGPVAKLFRAKALMFFGTGVEFETDSDKTTTVDGEEITIDEWLESTFNDIDNLLIDLGEDAIWFPRSNAEIVETRAGRFSHIEPVEPWTLQPVENEYGEVIAWEQEIRGTRESTIYQPDEIASFVLNKSCARDKTGISEAKRAEDEIRSWKQNQRAIDQAVDTAAFRRHWWKVGREGAGVIDDNELRRFRNRIDNLKDNRQVVSGRDVDHELMDAMNPDAFKSISEMDMRNLCVALGVPIELGSVISEGLGSGEQSGVRMQAFLLEARAQQRALADQFVQEIIRPVLEDYSPFPSDVNVELKFGEPLSEEPDLQEAAPYLTLDEIRTGHLDKPPAEDSEMGGSFRKPANVEAPEEEEPEEGGGFGGLFGSENVRELASDFEGDIFEIVAPEDSEQFEPGDTLAFGVDFPNSGVYVDWNVDAWPDDDKLSGPHVSEYDSIEDAQKVAEGDVKMLSGSDTGNRHLADAPEWDEPYLRIFEERIWADDNADKALVAFNESEVPEMVLERLKETIREGSVFSDIESIPSSELMDLRELLAENLGQDGWSLRDLSNTLADRFELSPDRAEMIARTETQAAVNNAREAAYEDREERGEEFRFEWVGPSDHRTTEACEWIKSEIPDEGVTLGELKELIQEAPEHDPEIDTRPREYTPHINCRHTYVRNV